MISRSSSNGMIHDYILYAGKYTELINPKSEFTTVFNIVRSLCLTIPQGFQYVKLYIDNFYNTLQLMLHLKTEFQIMTAGTMRQNRLHNAPLAKESELKKKGRGSYDEVVDCNSGLTLVRWYDKRVVTMASTFLVAEPLDNCRRYDKKSKAFVEILRPNIVKQYNCHMGGLDMQDMLLNLYQIDHKSRKYYFRIIYYLIGTAINNSWLEYRSTLEKHDDVPGTRTSLKNFILQICVGLAKVGKSSERKAGRPSLAVLQPSRRLPNEPVSHDSLRFDQVGHLPIHDVKGRCKDCSGGFSRWKCKKCGVHLCLNANSNCFSDYHTLSN